MQEEKKKVGNLFFVTIVEYICEDPVQPPRLFLVQYMEVNKAPPNAGRPGF